MLYTYNILYTVTVPMLLNDYNNISRSMKISVETSQNLTLSYILHNYLLKSCNLS